MSFDVFLQPLGADRGPEVDADAVYEVLAAHGCRPGGEFGFGAEIGIATGKMHARGPVGLEQLTSFKYQVRGSGQTRP